MCTTNIYNAVSMISPWITDRIIDDGMYQKNHYLHVQNHNILISNTLE